MHLIPSITITIALALAGTAQAATPDAQATAPTRASVEAAVLECHTQYADRYATHVDAAPSEIAAGSFAACRQQMDAFEALAPALAKQDEQVAIGLGDARAVERKIVARFRKHVRNATIDAVIRARAP
ncbi:hypothetical protein ACFONC_08425 [Luteimonas soli]|uniref:UrcA family protein n=1 Tax=Luteimonas soli TaxID=1648966 RepID=A0ABV7XMZ1_9GAMM